MSASLRSRLAMIVVAIDAGRYKTPEAAADDILGVILSVYPDHRKQLTDLLVQQGIITGSDL